MHDILTAIAALFAAVVLTFTPTPTAAAGTAFVTYPNWAGFSVSGDIHSVSAHWKVPPLHPGPAKSQAAFWIGIDNPGTIEQIGICDNEGRNYTVWYQMYPAAPVGVEGTVRPGDWMYGSVVYNGGGGFTLKIGNVTRHWHHVIHARSSSAAHRTAEVITEKSYGDLADFGAIRFTKVYINGRPLGQYNTDRIYMWNGELMLATPSKISNGHDFTVTWWLSR